MKSNIRVGLIQYDCALIKSWKFGKKGRSAEEKGCKSLGRVPAVRQGMREAAEARRGPGTDCPSQRSEGTGLPPGSDLQPAEL